MEKSEPIVVAYYSFVKVPFFLLLIFCWGLFPRIVGQGEGLRWVEVASYAIWLAGAAFFLHVIARRGRAVEMQDGRLFYGFWRRHDDAFSQIADVTLKVYTTYDLHVIGIILWKWDGTKVRLLGSIMKGRPETNVARLREVLGLPCESEAKILEKRKPW